MFKSCDYCRHRKKKCVLPYPCAGRCADCEHLDLVCEFSLRQPSLKRRRTSQRIASHLPAAAATAAAGSPRWRWPQSDSVSALVKDGDCQLTAAGGTGSSRGKIILKDDAPDRPESTAEKYWRYVYPLTPFLPPKMIVESNGDWDPILQHCVELAASLWLHHSQKQHHQPAADQLLDMVAHRELSLPVIAGILLLVLRMPLDDNLIQRASPPSYLICSMQKLTDNSSSTPFRELVSLAKYFPCPSSRVPSSPKAGCGWWAFRLHR
jgi:hypothetical protein